MKYLVASDIHGSNFYLDKLLEMVKKEKPNKIILLGDVLYHGPRNDLPKDYNPKEVCKKLNSLKNKILCIKGNCDAEVDEMVCEFKFKKHIKKKINDKNFFFTHGHKFNIDNIPLNTDVLVYGHFHTGFFKIKDNVLCVNSGSVSIPKEQTKNSYLTIENNLICLKDLEGNIIDKKQF